MTCRYCNYMDYDADRTGQTVYFCRYPSCAVEGPDGWKYCITAEDELPNWCPFLPYPEPFEPFVGGYWFRQGKKDEIPVVLVGGRLK